MVRPQQHEATKLNKQASQPVSERASEQNIERESGHLNVQASLLRSLAAAASPRLLETQSPPATADHHCFRPASLHSLPSAPPPPPLVDLCKQLGLADQLLLCYAFVLRLPLCAQSHPRAIRARRRRLSRRRTNTGH